MSVPVMKTFAKFRGAGGRVDESGERQRSVRSRIFTIRTSEHTRPIENKAKMLEILDDNSARPASSQQPATGAHVYNVTAILRVTYPPGRFLDIHAEYQGQTAF